MAITGDQRLLKRINRMALVRLVRSQPGLSRAELSVLTGLTKSTVSLLVQELIDESWLREDLVLVTGAIGRRPTPLRLDGRRLVMIGVELGVGNLCVVSMSLDGEVVASVQQSVSSPEHVDEVLETLAELIALQVQEQRAAGRELLGIGVGVPGAVMELTGVLAVAPNLGWRDVPLREALQAALARKGVTDLALFVQNDGDVAALGEVEFASTPVADPLLYIGLGIGVGSGLVVGGRLLLGGRGFAGEIGHIQQQADGPLCSCGRHGCAEAFFGLQAMANRLGCSIEMLETRAHAGEESARALLAEAGRHLGVLMHNLWTTLDPAVIVLGGPACRLGDAFLAPARACFGKLAHAAHLEIPPVVEARFGDLAVPAGAAALVLHKLLLPI
ncbi:MAG: xylose-responsive transcription regulator, family [Proteobacteria bacterium]|nr:xylose-responsive transcription regulator, family [Pseudomonadota bacterium]